MSFVMGSAITPAGCDHEVPSRSGPISLGEPTRYPIVRSYRQRSAVSSDVGPQVASPWVSILRLTQTWLPLFSPLHLQRGSPWDCVYLARLHLLLRRSSSPLLPPPNPGKAPKWS